MKDHTLNAHSFNINKRNKSITFSRIPVRLTKVEIFGHLLRLPEIQKRNNHTIVSSKGVESLANVVPAKSPIHSCLYIDIVVFSHRDCNASSTDTE
jgi:hypothetical protein